jgi:hypothetical protein
LFLLIIVYTLFNKIRDKGRTVSAWKQGGRRGKGRKWGRGEEKSGEEAGEMTQTLYAHMNKQKKSD